MCGARGVQRKRISVTLHSGVTVGGVEAEVCSSCGETYFDPQAMDQLEAARRPSGSGSRRTARRAKGT